MRIPLFLNIADAKKWISPDLNKPDIENLMKLFGASGMDSHTVSRLLTSQTADSNVPEVILREEYEALAVMVLDH